MTQKYKSFAETDNFVSMKDRMVEIFAELGRRMACFGDGFCTQEAAERAFEANGWFRPSETVLAAKNIAEDMLSAPALREWLGRYPALPVAEPRNVLVIMAGNIPFVGFQDLLCVLAAGHRAVVKLSSKDSVAMGYVISQLLDIDAGLPVAIDAGEKPDAVIAMGSSDAVRIFRERYSGVPMILRGSRSSLAVLDGTETEDELQGVADDVFTYSGLGCRNVSLLFVHRGYDIGVLQEALSSRAAGLNPKYTNNYRQLRAMLMLDGKPFTDCGCCALTAGREFSPVVSRINYAFYDDSSEVKVWVSEHDVEIQCVAGRLSHPRGVGLGLTQRPSLTDYPDGRDTMQFLAGID